MIVTAVILLAALGACAGSFAATAGLRAAAEMPWIRGRSQCDHCEVPIPYARSIPLVSYVWSKGRCAECAGFITPVHPLSECFGAVLLPACLLMLHPLQGGLIFLLAMLLLATAVFDIRTLRLPDRITLAVAAACLVLSLLNGLQPLLIGVVTAGLTLLLLQSLRLANRRTGRDTGLGFGDVKLLTALALWLGLATPWAVAGAALTGLLAINLLKPAGGRLPFGPFIAGSSLAVGLLRDSGPLERWL